MLKVYLVGVAVMLLILAISWYGFRKFNMPTPKEFLGRDWLFSCVLFVLLSWMSVVGLLWLWIDEVITNNKRKRGA